MQCNAKIMFSRCLLSHMQEDIAGAIDRNPGYRLVFTGHSLGIAATLLLY